MALTVATYVFVSSPQNGAFYSSFFTILAGLFGLLTINKCMLIYGISSSFIGTIIALVGAVQDGTAGDIVYTLKTCVYSSDLYSLDNYKYYGDSSYNLNAAFCLTGNWDGNTDCYCVNSDNKCYLYAGVPGNNCDNVLVGYLQRLSAAGSFDILAMVSCLTIFMLTSVSASIKPKAVALTSKQAAELYRNEEQLANGEDGLENQAAVYARSSSVKIVNNPLASHVPPPPPPVKPPAFL